MNRRLASGIEVDFIIGNMAVAIEEQATARIASDHFKGLRHLQRGARARHGTGRWRTVIGVAPDGFSTTGIRNRATAALAQLAREHFETIDGISVVSR